MTLYPGNVVALPDPYISQAVLGMDGRHWYRAVARAELTDTLQTDIPLLIYSQKPNSLLGNFPPKPLILPTGAQIHKVTLRLPANAAEGFEPTYGIDLPRNTTMVGTTGELVKVATTAAPYTPVAPAIASVGNAYAANASAVLARQTAQADQAAPNLLTTLVADTTYQISVSDAGSTAAGTGISLSAAGTAFIYADIFYALDGDAVKPWNLDLPVAPDGVQL